MNTENTKKDGQKECKDREVNESALLTARLEAQEDLQLMALGIAYMGLGIFPLGIIIFFLVVVGIYFLFPLLGIGLAFFPYALFGFLFVAFAFTMNNMGQDPGTARSYLRKSRTCPRCGASEDVESDSTTVVPCHSCKNPNVLFWWERMTRYLYEGLTYCYIVAALLAIVLTALMAA